jgi:hypothetical protein
MVPTVVALARFNTSLSVFKKNAVKYLIYRGGMYCVSYAKRRNHLHASAQMQERLFLLCGTSLFQPKFIVVEFLFVYRMPREGTAYMLRLRCKSASSFTMVLLVFNLFCVCVCVCVYRLQTEGTAYMLRLICKSASSFTMVLLFSILRASSAWTLSTPPTIRL